jgi:hypothetical protein
LIFSLHALLKFKAAWLAYEAKATGFDGGYYLGVAMNVRDGLGLVTYDSPFHHGLPEFPYPSPIYPIWPLTLGLLGRVWDIYVLANFLPAVFSVITVALAFRLGKKMFPNLRQPLFGGRLEIHPGHALALLFMIHPAYYDATVTPYTEGLAWLLLILFLLRARDLFAKQGILAGLEMGAWLAALFLTRSQFLVAIMALVAWMMTRLAFVRLLGRKAILDSLIFALASVLVFTLLVLPTLIRISGFALDPPFWTYLRFDQFQATRWLPQLQLMVEVDGPLGWLWDRLKGVRLAYLTVGDYSYFRVFSLLAIAIPAALVVGSILLLRQRRALGFWAAELVRNPFMHFVGILALGAWASLHTIHLASWIRWPFDNRQGMAAVLMIFLCWTFLFNLKKVRFVHGLALFLLLGTFVGRVEPMVQWSNRAAKATPDIPLVGEALPARVGKGPVLVGIDQGKLLAPWARGVGFHDLAVGDGAYEVSCLRSKLGVRFAALPLSDLRRPKMRLAFNLSIKDEELESFGQKLPAGWLLFEIPVGVKPCHGFDGRPQS